MDFYEPGDSISISRVLAHGVVALAAATCQAWQEVKMDEKSEMKPKVVLLAVAITVLWVLFAAGFLYFATR